MYLNNNDKITIGTLYNIGNNDFTVLGITVDEHNIGYILF